MRRQERPADAADCRACSPSADAKDLTLIHDPGPVRSAADLRRTDFALRDDLRIDIHPSGLVVEAFADCHAVRCRRTGVARYRLSARGRDPERLELELWTSQRGSIDLEVRDVEPWVVLEPAGEGGGGFSATDCSLHLEQLDRAHYWLGLSRDDALVHVEFRPAGYLEARRVSG